MGRTRLQRKYDDEVDLNQRLQDNENYLRKRCGLKEIGLNWNKICEILYPENPYLARRRLLEHIREDEMVEGEIYNEVQKGLSDYCFDATFFHGIANIIKEYFKDNYKPFIEHMSAISIIADQLEYPIDELFRQSYIHLRKEENKVKSN